MNLESHHKQMLDVADRGPDLNLNMNPAARNFQDTSVYKASKKNIDFEYNNLELPQVGTFNPPSFDELLSKTRDMFSKQHHILAKLS